MTRNARAGIAAVLVLGVVAVLAWQRQRALDAEAAAVTVDATRIDPANEGRRVSLRGELEVVQSPHDTDLGIQTRDAIALIREVEMLQWREDCSSDPCGYRLEWSAEPVRSDSFREPRGHANPASMPFTNARASARRATRLPARCCRLTSRPAFANAMVRCARATSPNRPRATCACAIVWCRQARAAWSASSAVTGSCPAPRAEFMRTTSGG